MSISGLGKLSVSSKAMPKLLTLPEVSELTGISYPTLVRQLRRYRDRIPSVGQGRRKRFPPEAVDLFKSLLAEMGTERGRSSDLFGDRSIQVDQSDLIALGSPLITLDLVSPELWLALSTNPELLRTLHWRDFERVLAGLLEKMEYEIELQRGTKDGGVDIFAVKNQGPFGAHRYLLQAKRSANAIGVEPIRELLFLHSEHRVSKACLATTSRFTNGAWKLAEQHKWKLELQDFLKLKEWVRALLGC
jgi:HJR/Mrr/RecB family endonuclease